MDYPTTPRNDHHLTTEIGPGGELSPPGSQESPNQSRPGPSLLTSRPLEDTAMDDDFDPDDADLYGPTDSGPQPRGAGATGGISNGGGDGVKAGGKYVPGSGWNNKKAQDEFHRALENVVDQDFTLREFGDVLLDGYEANGMEQSRS